MLDLMCKYIILYLFLCEYVHDLSLPTRTNRSKYRNDFENNFLVSLKYNETQILISKKYLVHKYFNLYLLLNLHIIAHRSNSYVNLLTVNRFDSKWSQTAFR